MATRTHFRPTGPGYRNELVNTAMHGGHSRMQECNRQAPPAYSPYDETHSQPPRYRDPLPYQLPRQLGRGMGHGTHLDRAQEYHLEPNLPYSGGRGRRHVYDTTVYSGTNYNTTHLDNDAHDNDYRICDIGGSRHRGRVGPRDVRGRQMDRCDGEFTGEMMGTRARDRYSRHGRRDSRSRSPVRVCGLGSGVRRGVEPRLDDFDDDLDLHRCGVRDFEGERRGTWAQVPRYSSEDALEDDDNITDDFPASRRHTNPYRSRYDSGLGNLFENFLEDDDSAGDFHVSRYGTGLPRSGSTFERESEFDDEDDRIGTIRAHDHFRQEADDEASEMERHQPRRRHRSRQRPECRRFGTIRDDYNSEGPHREADSEEEYVDRLTHRHVLTNRPHPASRSIPDSEDERTAQRIQRRRREEHHTRVPVIHPTDEVLDKNIEEDYPHSRHTRPQTAHGASNRRMRRGTVRSQAPGEAGPLQERKQAAPATHSSVTPALFTTSAQKNLARSAEPPHSHTGGTRTAIEDAVQEGPCAPHSYKADKQQTRQDRDAGSKHIGYAHSAANGYQPSTQNASADSRHTSEAKPGADSPPDSSDDGYDTPGSSAEGSEDGEFLQSFIRIAL